jgi:CheY-like chemotaxis protein
VLIVEDDDDLRMIMETKFILKGFKTFVASNGRDAFEILSRSKVDLVLSDVRMPNGDGIELLELLRESNPELPIVIFVTGFSEITLSEAYQKGASAMFVKPFESEQLMKTVNRLLTVKEERWKELGSPMEVNFNIELTSVDSDQLIEGQIISIGQGGMFAHIPGLLPKENDVVFFRICYRQGGLPFMEGKGIVRSVRERSVGKGSREFGLEFMELEERSRGELIQFIRDLKPKSFIPTK